MKITISVKHGLHTKSVSSGTEDHAGKQEPVVVDKKATKDRQQQLEEDKKQQEGKFVTVDEARQQAKQAVEKYLGRKPTSKQEYEATVRRMLVEKRGDQDAAANNR